MKFIHQLAKRGKNIFARRPVMAVFLGDSVTHGCFELTKSPGGEIETIYESDSAYHSLLKRTLGALIPNAVPCFVNAGISGDSAPGGADRFERDVLSFSPDLIVVCFGLNDVNGGRSGIAPYADALRRIFSMAKGNDREVIFMTPNMMNTYVSPLIVDPEIVDRARATAGLQNDGVMDAYMDAARGVCAEENIVICDTYRKWKYLADAGVDTTALLSNLINHPTREMHGLFASMLLQTLVGS